MLFISYAAGREAFPAYKKEFNQLIAERNLTVNIEADFHDESGLIYEVFSLVPGINKNSINLVQSNQNPVNYE